MKMRWQRPKPLKTNPRGTRIRDPLAVIPLSPENVEWKRDSQGLIQLRLRVRLKGFRKRLAGWLGYEYTKQIELDKLGSLFYEQVDGQRSLREIAAALLPPSGGSPRELEERLVLFTRMLMLKNVLILKVPDENLLQAALGE